MKRILCLLFLSGLVDNLIPEGNAQEGFRLIMGLFVFLAVSEYIVNALEYIF